MQIYKIQTCCALSNMCVCLLLWLCLFLVWRARERAREKERMLPFIICPYLSMSVDILLRHCVHVCICAFAWSFACVRERESTCECGRACARVRTHTRRVRWCSLKARRNVSSKQPQMTTHVLVAATGARRSQPRLWQRGEQEKGRLFEALLRFK